MRNLITSILPLLISSSVSAQVQKPGDVFENRIRQYPAPLFDSLDSREYKSLLNLARAREVGIEKSFIETWEQFKLAALARGYQAQDKAENPWKMGEATKEYFDTQEGALWSAGYIIRVTNKLVDGVPDKMVKVTVKSIKKNPLDTLNAIFPVIEGIKVENQAQENLGSYPGGSLDSYFEKGVTFGLESKDLGDRSLKDFAKFVPALLDIGIEAGTPLISHKVFATVMSPGELVLTGVEPAGIAFEAWSWTYHGEPFVADLSYGYDFKNYYSSGLAHYEGEAIMLYVLKADLSNILADHAEQWAGSKVRFLMNRPVDSINEEVRPVCQPDPRP